MNGRLGAGLASAVVSGTAGVFTWLDVAEQILRIAGSVVALVAGIVSLYLLLRKRGKQ